jgi:RNA-directed DNA polymerase
LSMTRIVYCKDSNRHGPWDGPVSFDFLGYAFRPRRSAGKNGRFTGFELAVRLAEAYRLIVQPSWAPRGCRG